MPARAAFSPLTYVDPRPSAWLIRALIPLNRAFLRHALRLEPFEFPAEDRRRLGEAVRPGTAAFLGPVHPEFTTDWLIDKEISALVSPLMAHWASYEIVNMNPALRRFWLANNLIANAPGGGGREYSVRWALAGHGVLLHPEGTATWHGDHVAPLLPGIVEMAWETCRRARAAGRPRPVRVVPLVWKLHFTRDVSRGLAREIAHVARALGLPAADGPLERRFARLTWDLLARQAGRLGLDDALAAARRERGDDYFAVQEACAEAILARLTARHGPADGSAARVIHTLRRAIRASAAADPEGARRDRAAIVEYERLCEFSRAIYGTPRLAQEQMAESLKRIRLALVTRGLGNTLHNFVPVAVGPRRPHVRVPEPLRVDEAFVDDAAAAAGRREELLAELHRRMAASLAALRAEVEPHVAPFERPNPLAGG